MDTERSDTDIDVCPTCGQEPTWLHWCAAWAAAHPICTTYLVTLATLVLLLLLA